jgi:hypothetical protein
MGAREQVINHFLLEGAALTPGRLWEGWLLATGKAIPESLRDRQKVDTTLAHSWGRYFGAALSQEDAGQRAGGGDSVEGCSMVSNGTDAYT